jgi:eukaryotic-like serine/threonine-protein kinase
MKNLLQKPLIKKILFTILGIIILILILDKLLMPWYVNKPEGVVPNVVGKTESEAVSILDNADFDPVVSDTTFDEKYPRGTIIFQRPKAGSVVKEGRNIYLFVSGGEPVVNVPQLRGRSLRDAKLALERVGLKMGKVEEINSENPAGMIFDQQFAAETPVKRGRTIDVSISIGSDEEGEMIVPDLIGKSLTEAQRVLADSSLSVGKINYQRSFSLLPNTILDQYPSKGNKIKPGGRVDLFVTTSAEERETEILEE